MVKKAYKSRIYPNKTQQQLLAQTFGCVRFVFNQLLDATKIMHTAKVQGQWKHPSKVDLVKAVKSLKEDRNFTFLQQVDSIPLQASAEDLADGFNRWFVLKPLCSIKPIGMVKQCNSSKLLIPAKCVTSVSILTKTVGKTLCFAVQLVDIVFCCTACGHCGHADSNATKK